MKYFEKLIEKIKSVKLYDWVIFAFLIAAILLHKPDGIGLLVSYTIDENTVGDASTLYINSGDSWNNGEKFTEIIEADGTCYIEPDTYSGVYETFKLRLDPITSELPVELLSLNIQQGDDIIQSWTGADLVSHIEETENVIELQVLDEKLRITSEGDDPEIEFDDYVSGMLLDAMKKNASMALMEGIGLVAILFVCRIAIEYIKNSKLKKASILVGMIMEVVILLAKIIEWYGMPLNLANVTMLIPMGSMVLWGYVLYMLFKEEINPSFMPMLSMLLLGMVLVIGGYLNLLKATSWIVFILGFVLFALKFKKDKVQEYYTNYGIITFIIMSVVVIVLYSYKPMNYHIWDEISHWGPFFKSIFEIDALPMYSAYEMTHGMYTQICMVIYYYLSMFMSDFNEPSTYALVNIMVNTGAISLLASVCKKKNALAIGVAVFALTFMSYVVELWPYSTIYFDAALATMAGSIIIFMYSLDKKILEKKYYGLLIVLVVAFNQIKLSGLPIALLCCAFYFILILLAEDALNIRKVFLSIVKFVTMVLVVVISQSLHNKLFVLAGAISTSDTSNTSSLQKIEQCYLDWKMNGEASFWSKMTTAYLEGLGTREIVGIPMTIWLLIFVGVFVVALLSRRFTNKELIILALLPVANVLMLLAIFYIYMSFIFERHLLLPSFERYITPLIVGCFMIVLFMFISKIGSLAYKRVVVVTLILATFSTCNFVNNSEENYFINSVTDSEAYSYRYRSISEKVKEYIEEGDMLYIISQGDIGLVTYRYQYELTGFCQVLEPRPSYAPPSISVEEAVLNQSSGTLSYTKISADDFAELIDTRGFDYILVEYSDEALLTGYGELFSDGIASGNPWDAKLYKVTDKNSVYELVDILYEN